MIVNRTIKAKYLIETAHPLAAAAESMAGEQSTGTFLKIPGETEELKAKHAAKVEKIEETATVAKPPKGISNPVYRRAYIELSWPFGNVGASLSNLVTTVAGNLFELSAFSGLKLIDIEIPEEFCKKYPGPRFGIEGTRKLTSVDNRPIIGTIVKPSVGLSPEATAEQVDQLVSAGLDFIKDDELMGDSPHSPFEKKVKKVMEVINRHADMTGKKVMVAFNISGDIDDMLRRHDTVLDNGGTCVMASVNSVGISGIVKLGKHTQLPIHGIAIDNKRYFEFIQLGEAR